MANFVHKLTRTKSTLRIITTLKTPKPTSPLIPHQTHIGTPKPQYTNNLNCPIPFLGHTITENVKNPSQSMHFYPNFPFGYCLNPIASTGFDRFEVAEAEEVESDDAGTVWADSVKKKRKKKMNKHKYKKLRKRLRRKT